MAEMTSEVKPAAGTAADTAADTAARTSLTAARDFVDTFVSTLDRAEFDQWLELFAADGYYAVVRQLELIQDNNVVLIGEDMKRLRARIASGRDRDNRRTVHSVSGVRVAAAGDEISLQLHPQRGQSRGKISCHCRHQ